MNKVMTRTRRYPGTRPPGRQDTRRPAGPAPRTTAPRTTAPRTTGPRTTPLRGTPVGTPQTESTPQTENTPEPTPTDSAPDTSPGARSTVTAGRGSPSRTTPCEGPLATPPQPRPTDLFADRLLAVLSGQRPVHCMLRHTAGRAYDELAWLAERGPLRARGTRPVVRDIGYYVPRAGAIEAFARIGAGDQLRAMAFRLEKGQDLRWRCTAVELGGARMPRTDDD
ncbi:hypothetical protein FE633_46145 [Streptomyces montanus]|uniref:Uncharacterized protein n=1 Tax=Streptomyces montanus TaxID=2580423 RepID=A0A5R9FAM6_9ACTN|nr:Rv3235 family protein [Streptomyces montanus]TLS39579.1 hypothetical protein FE633_46145 [Streptomyces montanus]